MLFLESYGYSWKKDELRSDIEDYDFDIICIADMQFTVIRRSPTQQFAASISPMSVSLMWHYACE